MSATKPRLDFRSVELTAAISNTLSQKPFWMSCQMSANDSDIVLVAESLEHVLDLRSFAVCLTKRSTNCEGRSGELHNASAGFPCRSAEVAMRVRR